MDLLDSVTSWIGKNTSWLKPVASAGINAFNAYDQGSKTRDYTQRLERAQREDYDRQKAEYDAYTQYLTNSVAADNAAAGSRAAAARANEAARVAGVKDAIKQTKGTYGKMDPYLKPFADTGLRMLPKIEGAFSNSLDAYTNLLSKAMGPEMSGRMNASKPIYDVGAPIADYFRNRK